MEKYKVFKVFRKTARKVTIEKNLTRDEAIRLVNRFPNNDKTMVCFTKQ